MKQTCPTLGAECLGCPDCPGASSTGLTSGDITNEDAREELEAWEISGHVGDKLPGDHDQADGGKLASAVIAIESLGYVYRGQGRWVRVWNTGA